MREVFAEYRAVGRLPRRGLQARAADGGEPGRGGAQQRGGHPHRGRGGGRGRRGALRARLDRQGGEPGHRDGRLEGARGVGGGGGAEPLEGHALRVGALRQRARLVGLGGADLPPPDRAGRAGHRHRREDDPLLHDDPRGGAADHPLGRARHGRRGVRARDGRPGEDRRAGPQHDPPGRPGAGGGHRRSRSSAGAPARRSTRSSSTPASARARRPPRRSCARRAARFDPEWVEERVRPDRGARVRGRRRGPGGAVAELSVERALAVQGG